MKNWICLLSAVLFIYQDVVLADKMPTAPPLDSELPMLPEYCAVRVRLGLDSSNPKVAYWKQILGANYADMHHYCRAQNWFNRAKTAFNDPYKKKYCLGNALTEINYTINHLKPGFPFESEVYVIKGDILVAQEDPGAAIIEYDKSIALKRNYIRAYRSKAKVLIDMGNSQQAISVIEAGLKENPKSRSLRRLRKKIRE